MAMRPREASSARLSARVLAARDAAIPAGVPQGAGKRRRPESRPRSAPARTARCVRRRRPDRRPDQARDLRSRPAGEDERDRPADPAARRNALVRLPAVPNRAGYPPDTTGSRNSPLTAAAAAAWVSRSTWAYRSSVMATDAWPIRSWTTFGLMPALSASVAQAAVSYTHLTLPTIYSV